MYFKELEKAAEEAAKAAKDALEKSLSDAMKALTRAVNARNKALQDEARAVNDSVRALTGLRTALQNAFKQIVPTVTTQPTQFAQSQAVLFGALESARITGEVPTQEEIADHLATVSRNNTDQYATFEDYAYDQAMNARVIRDLEELAGKQLTTEEKALVALNEQIEQNNQLIVKYQEQIDTLNGIDNSILSVADAVAKVEAAIRSMSVSQQAASASSVSPAASTGSTSSASQTTTSSGSKSGYSVVDYGNSATYYTPGGGSHTIQGAGAASILQSLYSSNLHGSHATGLDYVPFDGYRAELHKGEMVVPKAQSDFLRMGGIVVELQALRSEVSMLREQDKQIGLNLIRNTADSAEYL
jgi:hypothetical protein